MASAVVAVAKLKIPNKAVHIKDRDELNGKYEELRERIDEFPTRRDLLKEQETTNITLDNAVDVLNQLKQNVQMFNQKCQSTQNRIYINNGELQQLLDRITTEIAQAQATKAAADAAAAVAAEEAAALQNAKNALQGYITSLQTQLKGINDNNLNDIGQQIQNSANTIKQYDAVLDASVSGAGEAISQATRDLITTFNTDTRAEVLSNTQRFNTFNEEFDDAKKTIVDGLNERIQALKGVAGGAGVTADAIQTALDTDTQNPIDDKNLGEIKGRAAELAAKFGTKATDFATKKAEIDQKIETDRAAFQEKQKIIEEYQGIMRILDSQEVKDKEAAIQENIEKAQVAENAAADAVTMVLVNITQKMLKNVKLGNEITILNTSISSLERELAEKLKSLNIQNLESKLQELQTRSAKIQPPHIDLAPIQARLNAINEAKAEYERLKQIQEARMKALTAENNAARSRSPSPVSSRGSSSISRTEAARRIGGPKTPESVSESENGEADTSSTPLMDQLGKRPRSRPLFQDASALVKRRYVRIPPTLNETDPIYLIDLDSGGGGGAGAGGGGGKMIQHGGQPPQSLPTGAVIYELNPTYEDNILLLASLKSAKVVLNDDELIEKLEKKATKITDATSVSNTYSTIQNQLISSEDTGLLTIARRAVYQSSILKLMAILDSKIPRNKGLISYTDMYLLLWTFMNPYEAAGIIKQLIKDTQPKPEFVLPSVISNIVGWIPRTSTNPNLDKYFDVFINCTGSSKSTFLTSVTQKVDKKTGKSYSLDKQVAYRVKLNWIILIAFYCLQTFPRQITYINVGELIINTYETFLGWMERDNDTYEGMFLSSRNPVLETAKATYSKRIDYNIKANIHGDTTLATKIDSLKTRITEKLCEGQMTKDAENHKNEPDEESPKVGPPSVEPLSDEKVFEQVSNLATTTSPSTRQAWMMDPTSRNPIGPKTPPSPPGQSRPTGQTNPLASRRGVQVSPKSEPPVPALNFESLQQTPEAKPQETQSARRSKELLSDLQRQRQLPQSARMPPRPGNIKSQRPGNVNIHNPFGRKSQSGSFLPGDNVVSQPVGHPDSEGTGNLELLSTQPENSPYAVLTQPVPPKTGAPVSGNPLFKRTAKQNKQDAGHKRTRKHRTPASSTPAPATRRHRDYSSSSHKRTRRRQRPQRREH